MFGLGPFSGAPFAALPDAATFPGPVPDPGGSFSTGLPPRAPRTCLSVAVLVATAQAALYQPPAQVNLNWPAPQPPRATTKAPLAPFIQGVAFAPANATGDLGSAPLWPPRAKLAPVRAALLPAAIYPGAAATGAIDVYFTLPVFNTAPKWRLNAYQALADGAATASASLADTWSWPPLLPPRGQRGFNAGLLNSATSPWLISVPVVPPYPPGSITTPPSLGNLITTALGSNSNITSSRSNNQITTARTDQSTITSNGPVTPTTRIT